MDFLVRFNPGLNGLAGHPGRDDDSGREPFTKVQHTQANVDAGGGIYVSRRTQPDEPVTLGKVEMKDKNQPLIDGQQADCLLEPGTLVAESGLYEICHTGGSRSTVILIKNTVFPYCRDCGEDIRFKLIKAAPHISEDPDFIAFVGDPEYDSQDSTDPTIVFLMQLGPDHGFRYSQQDIQAG